MRSRLRSHLAIAAIAAVAASAGAGLIAGTAGADHESFRDSYARLRTENAQLRSDLSHYQAAHDELLSGLDRVERAAFRSRDRRVRDSIDRIVDETRERVERHLNWRQPDHPDYPDRPSYPDTPQARPPIDPAAFDGLLQSVRRGGFADAQLEIVRAAAPVNYFTVDQVVSLMKAIPFDDTRIEVAVLLYPRIVDPDRWFKVFDAFAFSQSGQTLRQRLGQ